MEGIFYNQLVRSSFYLCSHSTGLVLCFPPLWMCFFMLPSPTRARDGMKRAWALFPPTEDHVGGSSLRSGLGPLCWHLACHRVSLSWWERSLQPHLGQGQDVKGSRWLERPLAHSDTGSFTTANLDWVWYVRADWSYLLFALCSG